MPEAAILTIGMPVYNGADDLAQTLDNILAQTCQNFKIIISNNGSTDNTAEICNAYVEKDARISVYHQPKTLKQIENFSFVKNKADTEFYAWCADDDARDPDFFEKLILALQNDKKAVLAFGDIVQISLDGETKKLKLDFPQTGKNKLSQLYWTAIHPLHYLYGVWRTDIVQKIKWEDTNWSNDLPVMMAARTMGEFAYVPDVHLHYLDNRYPFFRGKFQIKMLVSRTVDILHLVYKTVETVNGVKGPLYAVMAGGCVVARTFHQIIVFVANRTITKKVA